MHDQLVDLSAAQDVEAGDGTTSVVVLAGSLLGAAEKMLQKGIHPTVIAESFQKASTKAVEYLTEISTPINLDDKTSLLRAATTSLDSKVGLSYVPDCAKFTPVVPLDCLTVLFDPCSYCCVSGHSPCHPDVFQCRSSGHSRSQESWWHD